MTDIPIDVEALEPGEEPYRKPPPEPMTFVEVLKLFLRTWPYIKPVRWHVIGWFCPAAAGDAPVPRFELRGRGSA